MTNALSEVTPFVYTSPQGLKLEVLFVLDPEKKGYLNATAIGKQFGKEPYDWLKYQPVQDYISALIEQMKKCSDNYRSEAKSTNYDNSLIPLMSDYNRTSTKSITYNDLVLTVNGAPANGGGTWLHPKLAVFFARWLSPHFAVWCDGQIETLLHQHPEHQKQFPELAPLLFKVMANLEQRIVERVEHTIAQMLNHWQAQSAQDNKYALGQIFNGINQLNKTLSRQQQADLFKPPVEDVIRQTLINHQDSSYQMLQQMLQQMLRGQQDELIQNYLLSMKDYLEQIVQRLAAEPTPVTHGSTSSPHVIQPAIATTELATEIAALKAQSWSWQRIAQELNARGTATTSGKGQWHGSSVKRYLESHAAA